MAGERTVSGNGAGPADADAESARAASTRGRVEARLEALVASNRVTIAVVFPTVGAVLILASAGGYLPPVLSFNPFLILAGTAVMRLPLAAGLAPLLDRRAVAAIGLLAAYTYAVEFVGATTGFPYGEFSYGVALGPMLGGTIPLALPLFFLPLVLDGYLLADRLRLDRDLPGWTRPVAAVAAILAIDLVLDPAAVAVGFWHYAADGPLYGVPLSNFLGWALSATVAVALVEIGFDRAALRERARTCSFLLDDLVSFVVLWGLIVATTGRWLSLGIALALLGLLVSTGYLRAGTSFSGPG